MISRTNLPAIRFGTDGWRGIIAKDFTFANVECVAQAIAGQWRASPEGKRARPLLVGHDTRFLSPEFACAVAGVLAGNGVPVWLATEATPTPVLSWTVVSHRLAGAIIITASHNPPQYNGIKFKGAYGGPAVPELTNAIEARLHRETVRSAPPGSAAWQRLVKEVTLDRPYLAQLRRYVKMSLIKKSRLTVVVDPMYGAGCGYLSRILEATRHRVVQIHQQPHPTFGGLRPEPIEENLHGLARAVKASHADVGLATDGDGDRIGVVDAHGRYVDSQHLMALFILHMIRVRGWRGSVVRTLAVTRCLDRIANRYGLPLHETPIGFKHIAAIMLRETVLLGGEESGGMSFYGTVPERDGLLASLLVLEMMGATGLPLHEMVQNLERDFGRFVYRRVDLSVDARRHAALTAWLPRLEARSIHGRRVLARKRLDGTLFTLDDGSWVLMRLSGTEPVMRLYAEAPTERAVKALLQFGTSRLRQAEKTDARKGGKG